MSSYPGGGQKVQRDTAVKPSKAPPGKPVRPFRAVIRKITRRGRA